MKIGFGISTFIKYENRKEYLIKSLDSLFSSVSRNDVLYYLVDDGSPINVVDEIKSKYPFLNIYRKKNNEGISKSKNDQIRYFMENKVDIIILADDDNIYDKEIIETCIKGLEFSDFLICGGIQFGYFLCFKKIVVETIGYFVKCPYVYGGEHHEYAKRYFRVTQKEENCRNYELEKKVKNFFGSSSIEIDRNMENKNKEFLNSENRIFVSY